MLSANLSAIFYLISGVLFILALRGLSSPETSRQGNYFGMAGMIIAIIVTFLLIGNFSPIVPVQAINIWFGLFSVGFSSSEICFDANNFDKFKDIFLREL